MALAEARSVSVPVGVPDARGDTEREGVAGGLTDIESVGDADAITVEVIEADTPVVSVAVGDGVGLGVVMVPDGRGPRTYSSSDGDEHEI